MGDASEARKLTKYQAEVGAYASEVNTNVQEFTLNLQKHSTDYAWYQGQYTQLKADYIAGLTALKGTQQ